MLLINAALTALMSSIRLPPCLCSSGFIVRVCLPSEGQKKNFSQQREKSTHQKRKHWSHSKNGCKLIFQFCAHHLGLHAPVSFSIRSFSIYFIIEAQNVSMLSVSFPCEKVCIRKPRILATLPKSPSSPPRRQRPCAKKSSFLFLYPTISLYIKVQMCYYNVYQRGGRHCGRQNGGFLLWVF